ncbi:hypothetical protein RRG08_061271 [Elysia crispata]|uniref:Uncharacterized protein n=1 Tax=Elysia crispata TaxID=231223 RepID=A0AAE1DFN8_9GAST|nr:hypothetical protein RRG08_061271 [Elysia crispata]
MLPNDSNTSSSCLSDMRHVLAGDSATSTAGRCNRTTTNMITSIMHFTTIGSTQYSHLQHSGRICKRDISKRKLMTTSSADDN